MTSAVPHVKRWWSLGPWLLVAAAIAMAAAIQPALGVVFPVMITVAAVCVAAPTVGTWTLLAGLMSFSEYVAVQRYDVGIGLFCADLTLPLLLGVALRMLPRSGADPRPEDATLPPGSFPLIGLAIYSGVAIAWALGGMHHAIRDVAGDYRRFFVYPMIFFVGVFVARQTPHALRRVIRIGTVAAIPIGMVAAFRVVTGISYRPDQFGGEFRAFSFYDSTILFLPFLYFLTVAAIDRDRRFAAAAAVGALGALEIASGYRLAWALVVVGPALAAALLAVRTRRYGLVATLLFAPLAIGLALAGIVGLAPGLASVWRGRLSDLVFMLAHIGLSWRYLSWISALSLFIHHPILGVGIGDVHTFWTVNSAGIPTLTTHTTHNILVSIIYQTGLVGLALFIAIHASYVRAFWKAIINAPLERLPYLIGLAGFYVAAVAVSNFQPFLDDPGGAVLLYLLMGLSIPELQRTGTTPGEVGARNTPRSR